MKHTKKIFLFTLVLLWAAEFPLQAQEGVIPLSQGDIRFAVDHAGFMDSSGRTRETFFCQIGYDQVHFVRQGGRYVARMELTAILYDGKGNQIAGDNWDKAYEVKDYVATVASGRPLLESFSFLLDPGTYRLRVELADLGADSKGIYQGNVLVPSLSRSRTQFSEPVFLTAPLPGTEESLSLDPSRLNPSRVYPDSVPTVRWFFVVYGPVPPGAKLLYAVSDVLGKRRTWETRPCTESGPSSSRGIQDSLSLFSLEAGAYLLTFSLTDHEGKSLSQREARFDYQPFYAPLALSYEEALELLGYLATPAELDSLKKAPPSARRAAWESFWRKRDPSSGTDRNEAREEFYERVAYANNNFSRFHKGWKTDRGRVYIKFGPPEEVERHPFDADSPAYEIWYYYALNRQFLFVDQHGLGDYTLSNWGVYLRK